MKKFALLVGVCVLSLPGMAQQKSKAPAPAPKSVATKVAKPVDELLFTFGTDTVYRSEFERIYSKNNNTKDKPDEKSIREYLDLYINFKLKVKEAMRLGLDTSASFISELSGYRKQLAQPYMVDSSVSELLVKEAYDRMKWEVNASHILIRCEENALPKDTQAAYKRIMDCRNRVMKGESFDSVAAKYSEDPSAVNNYGNLGWFTAFQMIYPFETGAYTTQPGKVSMPLRTRFGYHIVKVLDRRPSMGEVKVAHIALRVASNATEEQKKEIKGKVDAIYSKLKSGERFEDLVKQYSEDERSAGQRGELNWLSGTSTSVPAEFKEAAFQLKANGDYSMPVKTSFGWHIIKRIDKKELQSLAELRDNIKTKIARDSRQDQNRQAVIERVKKQNRFTENKVAFAELAKTVDSSLIKNVWSAERAKGLNKPLCTFGGKSITQSEFAEYVAANQTNYVTTNMSIDALLKAMYKNYVDGKLLEFEENSLDEKVEDFRNLMKEYHDGILLFDLTDKKVWSKAVTDTVGLQAFYEKTKGKYLYKERYAIETFYCADAKTAEAVKKMIKSGKTNQEIKTKLNAKNPLAVEIRDRKVELGEDSKLDEFVKNNKPAAKPGDTKFFVPDPQNANAFTVVREVLPPQPKELKDVKGLVTSDYQSQLEKEWLAELRARYPVQVNQAMVEHLFK